MASDVQFIGPFEHHRVVVDGRRVPSLTARPHEDGSATLIIDNRLALEVPAGLVIQVTAFVANAIAFGMGYACHPGSDADPTKINPFPIVMYMGDRRNGMRVADTEGANDDN